MSCLEISRKFLYKAENSAGLLHSMYNMEWKLFHWFVQRLQLVVKPPNMFENFNMKDHERNIETLCSLFNPMLRSFSLK